jgi:hypothetical protein
LIVCWQLLRANTGNTSLDWIPRNKNTNLYTMHRLSRQQSSTGTREVRKASSRGNKTQAQLNLYPHKRLKAGAV